MKKLYKHISMLILCISCVSFVFPNMVYATTSVGVETPSLKYSTEKTKEESKDLGFVEKNLILTINQVASALDIENFSIDNLIYGINGSGLPSKWEKSPYAFNGKKGNIFYDIYYGSYGVFRSIGIMLVSIYVGYLAIKGLFAGASNKDYFKSGILALISTTLLFLMLPGILNYIFIIRELLLDVIYSLSSVLSGVADGGFIAGLRDNASSTTAELQDSLFYLAGVILSVYFIFIYVCMGISFVLCMWLSPTLITTSSEKANQKIEFFKYISGLVITPCIDAALLILPLVMAAKSDQVLVTIATFAAIIPTRTWIRKLLGVGTGVSEMMGMGFAVMGAQALGSVTGGAINAGKKLTQGVEHGQKAKMFNSLSKAESSNSTGSDKQAQIGYGNNNYGEESLGSSFAANTGNSSQKMDFAQASANANNFSQASTMTNAGQNGKGNIRREQTAAETAMFNKYGNKSWFKDSGIQMTNEQKAQSEMYNALKSFGSAAGGLGGRTIGMGVGAAVFSGYGASGVVAGAKVGGDIGDAIGSKIGERVPFKSRYENSLGQFGPYKVNSGQYNLPYTQTDMLEGEERKMLEHKDYPMTPTGGGGNAIVPSSNESIEVKLMDGFNDFKVQNEAILRTDFNQNVPQYANSVMDSNKDTLLGDALGNYASSRNYDIKSPLFTSPQMKNDIHDAAKQQVVSSIVTGDNNQQYRDTFAKQVHSQEVSKVVTGESRIKAEQLADRQLNEFSDSINNHIGNNYESFVSNYLDNYIKSNGNKLVSGNGKEN